MFGSCIGDQRPETQTLKSLEISIQVTIYRKFSYSCTSAVESTVKQLLPLLMHQYLQCKLMLQCVRRAKTSTPENCKKKKSTVAVIPCLSV